MRKIERRFVKDLWRARPSELNVTWCGMGRTHDWESGRRRLDEHILWFLLEGRIVGTVNGAAVEISEGDFFWMNAGAPHAMRMEGSLLRNFFLRFRLKSGGRLAKEYYIQKRDADLRAWMDQMHLMWNYPEAFRFEKMRALLGCCAAKIAGGPAEAGQDAGGFSQGQVWRIRNCLDERANPTPNELAAAVGLSADYFSRKFQRHFGVAPKEYIQRERVGRAEVLLSESSLSVKEIASRLGFETPQYFARVFRSQMGRSPMEYRAAH